MPVSLRARVRSIRALEVIPSSDSFNCDAIEDGYIRHLSFHSVHLDNKLRSIKASRMKASRILQQIILLSGLFLIACGGSSSTSSLDAASAAGERVFKRECSVCHSVKPGENLVGPSLAGIATRAGLRMEGMDSREYIHFSIIKPSEYVVDGFIDQMPPGFGKSLDENELDGIISYLLTLE